jgi:hypothetical protein
VRPRAAAEVERRSWEQGVGFIGELTAGGQRKSLPDEGRQGISEA